MNQFCKIIDQKSFTEDIYRVTLESKLIAETCQPGQFVHFRVTPHIDPLLRRPFSVHRANREKSTFDVLYRVIGRGTDLMQQMKPGDCLDTMGPLGNGFQLEGDYTDAIVVAGGMGSAPVFMLIDFLIDLGKRVTFIWGARMAKEFFDLDDLRRLGVEVRLATDDGSMGHCGLVTQLMETFLEESHSTNARRGFVCGPEAMLACVQPIAAKSGFSWQVSLEERMACGIGVCQGCAVKDVSKAYRMVCSDGPVFDLGEVVFDG